VARLDRCCKHVGDSRRALAKDMGVDPERDSRVRMSETVGDHMEALSRVQPAVTQPADGRQSASRKEMGADDDDGIDPADDPLAAAIST
jgi:hypothetical protein